MQGATDESWPRHNSSASNLPSLIGSIDFRHRSVELPARFDSRLFVFRPNCCGCVTRSLIKICGAFQVSARKFRATPFEASDFRGAATAGQLFSSTGRANLQSRRSIFYLSPITVPSLLLVACAENSPQAIAL